MQYSWTAPQTAASKSNQHLSETIKELYSFMKTGFMTGLLYKAAFVFARCT